MDDEKAIDKSLRLSAEHKFIQLHAAACGRSFPINFRMRSDYAITCPSHEESPFHSCGNIDNFHIVDAVQSMNSFVLVTAQHKLCSHIYQPSSSSN